MLENEELTGAFGRGRKKSTPESAFSLVIWSFGISDQERIQVGMADINVPVPVPMAWHGYGGWKRSMFGDMHAYGEEGTVLYEAEVDHAALAGEHRQGR